jgi:ATP-binding cassette, subfamily B, bacterial
VLDGLSSTALLALCALLVLLSVALRALCEYLATVGFALTGSRVLGQLRHDLYCHLQRLSLAFHDRTRTGDLTMRVVNDVSSMREAMVTALLPFATNVLILFSMAGVMLLLDWRLALVALAPLPLLAFATVRLGGRIQQVSREQRKREGGVAATTAEALGGIRMVQALSLEGRMARIFEASNAGSLADGVKAKRLAASLERATDLVSGLSTALTLWYGALLVLRGQITAGDLVVFLTYLKNTFRPIRDFAKNSSRIAKATAAGERIADLLEEQPQIREIKDAYRAPRLAGVIRFDQVHFAHGDGKQVLDGFDCKIAPGELVALVGPSGAGKSTFASLLLRLYDPTAGSIRIDGHDIRQLTLASLRGQIGVVLQDTLLLAETVRENIALARPEASLAEIEAAARLAGAHDFIAALPEGYDTVLAERGASLSTGQRQRLALARAALRASPILLLDEPTNGLDPDNEALVIAAIHRLARRATVVLITHDMALAASADRVLVLAEGRLAEQGPPKELLAQNSLFAALHADRPIASSGGLRAVAG